MTRPRAKRPLFPMLAAFLAMLVCAACATPPYATGRERTVPEDFFGTSPGFYAVAPEDYPLLDDMGTGFWRGAYDWSGIEPREGEWNFSVYDRAIENARSRGKKSVLLLAYDVAWVHADKREHDTITARELPYYLRYVEKSAERYKGKVYAWEIWNEPNMPRFWKSGPAAFAAMTLAAAKKVRETDPGARITAGSLWRVPKRYVRHLFKSGAMDYVDAMAFHPYAINPAGAVKTADRMWRELGKYDYKGELWITEVGFPTGGWYPSRVSEKNFPKYIIKTLAGLAVRDIRHLSWYEYKQSYPFGKEPSKLDSESFFGLVDAERKPKAGFHAYALCGNYLAGARYIPALPAREGVPERVVSLCFSKKGQGILILWDERGGKKTYRLSLPGTEQTLHNIGTREKTALAPEAALTIGADPVFITWKEAGGTPVLAKEE